MSSYETLFYSPRVHLIAGVDEAGRGPLAGPIVAAAVVFRAEYYNPRIDDSKKLNSRQREELYTEIVKEAVAYSIVICSPEEIDKQGIHLVNRLVLERAITGLDCHVDLIISDAFNLLNMPVPLIPLIDGDAKSQVVGAASILAKVTRDRLMIALDTRYPEYGFAEHKGYGTAQHLEALQKHGPIPQVHRYSYKPIKNLL